MTAYGTIVTGPRVERAMLATLKTWLPSQVWEVAKQDVDSGGSQTAAKIALPKGWGRRSDFDKWPENQMPYVTVLCPGLTGAPTREGDTSHNAVWAVAVGVLVSATSEEVCRDLAGVYGAAVRSLVLQHKSLGGFADAVSWVDEDYDLLDSDRTRTLGAARVVFEVEVRDVVTSRGGPEAPPALPTTVNPGDPVITLVDVDAERVDALPPS